MNAEDDAGRPPTPGDIIGSRLLWRSDLDAVMAALAHHGFEVVSSDVAKLGRSVLCTPESPEPTWSTWSWNSCLSGIYARAGVERPS